MKHATQLLVLTLCLLFYSCGSEEKRKVAFSGGIIQKTQAVIEFQNGDCDFLALEIIKNYNDTYPIKLIGIFENLRITGEHTYGYMIRLWKLNEDVFGFFDVHEGSLDPDRSGLIVNGKIDKDSLHFKVSTKQGKAFKDWEKSDVHVYTFTGQKTDNKITGHFSIYDCSSETLNKNDGEQVELPYSNMWKIEHSDNISDWITNYSYRFEGK